MMAFIHLFEYAKGVGSDMAKEHYIALKNLGAGSMFYGLYAPDTSIKNPFEKRNVNHQLGLFDDFLELGAVGKFAKLGFNEKFMKNPVLKHPKLTKDGAMFLYEFYNLYKDLKGIKQPRTIVKKIAASKLFEHIALVLATKRAQLKDGSIDEKLKEEALIKIKRKTILLEELSLPYKEHERVLNAMILGSNDLTQGEGVNLLSIHASKGLEFCEVYVIDLMDGRFPNRKLASRGGSIDEERRLFYVAVTRAKDILYLSYAKYDKIKKTQFVASQFLYEASLIPKDEHYKKMVQKKEDEL
jgi:DNA helicase-2/ATP-dependent DNA helicase PcrA